jgi:hypothetical protein
VGGLHPDLCCRPPARALPDGYNAQPKSDGESRSPHGIRGLAQRERTGFVHQMSKVPTNAARSVSSQARSAVEGTNDPPTLRQLFVDHLRVHAQWFREARKWAKREFRKLEWSFRACRSFADVETLIGEDRLTALGGGAGMESHRAVAESLGYGGTLLRADVARVCGIHVITKVARLLIEAVGGCLGTNLPPVMQMIRVSAGALPDIAGRPCQFWDQCVMPELKRSFAKRFEQQTADAWTVLFDRAVACEILADVLDVPEGFETQNAAPPVGGRPDDGPDPGSAKNGLAPAHETAYRLYLWATQQAHGLAKQTDNEFFNWLKQHGTDKDEVPAPEGYELPERETFKAYLRKARAFYDTSKYRRRHGRSGRSVVRHTDL